MTMIRSQRFGVVYLFFSPGRFVNVTSVLSRVAVPCRAPYCMSKIAGETFSDVLRYEMHKWGVKVGDPNVEQSLCIFCIIKATLGVIGHIEDPLIILFGCIVGRKRVQNLPIFAPFSFPQCIRKG